MRPCLQAKDLVSKLCVVDLSHRYGMMARGIADIKVGTAAIAIGALGHWGIGALGHWGIGALGTARHVLHTHCAPSFLD